MTLATLSTWHELVRTQNTKGLSSVLADEVIVFYSPVVHAPQIGKAITLHNLSGAFRVFLNESFRCVRELTGPWEAVLEFQVEIEGVNVNGVDMIKWDDEGKIVEFKVLVRPSQGSQLDPSEDGCHAAGKIVIVAAFGTLNPSRRALHNLLERDSRPSPYTSHRG